MDESKPRDEGHELPDLQALGSSGRREMAAGLKGKQPGGIPAKCDGKRCNIRGAVTVEWCTECDYFDAGCSPG